MVALTPTLTPGSKGLVGERLLSLMKPTAILINTSRGAVVDEKALAKALREGWMAERRDWMCLNGNFLIRIPVRIPAFWSFPTSF